MVPALADKKLKGLHPLRILPFVVGLIYISYGIWLFIFPNQLLNQGCMLEPECVFRARAMAQFSVLSGALWIGVNFMDRTARYVFGWVFAINALAFLANTNIGWALGYVPPQHDLFFAPAGAAYMRSFEAIFGFWLAIRAFEPEEGFAAAEAARKKQLHKSS